MSSLAHLSLTEYDRMIADGAFTGGNRVELVQGEIREMAPIGPGHEEIVERLTAWSYDNVPRDRVRIRVQDSIGLPSLQSVPEPDIAWVVERKYSRARPTANDVFLVIEVAESSLYYDTGEKARLYAAAEIEDYWVVNLREERIEVYREPRDGIYRNITIHAGPAALFPLRFPDIALHPDKLWEA